jgi:hypothetical protein
MTDIVERLERVVRRHILKSMPPANNQLLVQMSFTNLLVEYRTWRGRFVAPQPRTVVISRELQESAALQEYSDALTALGQKIEAGEDLTPNLSTRIHQPFENIEAPSLEHRTDRDSMLAEWGLHHLHLSKKLRGGAARRGNDVLFAAFTSDTAYLIDIRAHPKHANWAAEDLFAIVVRNWPDSGLVHKTKALGLTQHYSDEDRLQLRNAGISTMMEIDGKVYAPGPLGQTLAGTPIQATREAQALIWALRPWRENFDATLATFSSVPADAYWTPAIHTPRPGFEEYCGFATTTSDGSTFVPVGRLC